jgi:hypothetical protein
LYSMLQPKSVFRYFPLQVSSLDAKLGFLGSYFGPSLSSSRGNLQVHGFRLQKSIHVKSDCVESSARSYHFPDAIRQVAQIGIEEPRRVQAAEEPRLREHAEVCAIEGGRNHPQPSAIAFQ